LGMDQYLLIPFLGGWTSINPSYFDVHQGKPCFPVDFPFSQSFRASAPQELDQLLRRFNCAALTSPGRALNGTVKMVISWWLNRT
jgi:hypothetical protein